MQLPVKGDTAVDILLNDHVIVKQLLDQLDTATDAARRSETLEQLKAVLTVHNATEENFVYPAIAVIARRHAESQALYAETAAADTLIFEIDTLLKLGDDDGATPRVKKFTKAVRAHIDEEETKAFPTLREKAEPEQEEQLTASVREFRSALSIKTKTAA